MQNLSPDKADLKILVVEDNLLIADTIGEVVESCGCAVVGPVGNLESGLALLDEDRLDGALLDINLAGTLSFPLASALEARGVPFVFMTGYDEGTIFPREFSAVRRLTKPFDHREVAEVLEVWGRMAGGQPPRTPRIN
jgi:DNA-binding response OmpR family regulator